MSVIKKVVVLLKAGSDDFKDDYEVILTSKGFNVKHVKTLDFNYINLEKLKTKLVKPEDYSGVIFSSPRCVNAVKLALNNEKLDTDWKLKHNFVVGEATYRVALEDLDLDCLGKDTGNANNLSTVILKEKDKYLKKFLYPHGNLKMDILQNNLANTNIRFDEIMVYETISDKSIMKEFNQITNNLTYLPEYIVFFSPSGIKAMEEVLKVLPLKLIKIVSIGPTTEAATLKAGIPVFGTAEKPNAQNVLDILLKDL